MKQFIIKNKWSIVVIFLLLIVILYLFYQVTYLKNSLLVCQSTPRINLFNTLSYSSNNKLFGGSVAGFVAFKNVKSQPHDLTQYYVIQPLNKLDENLNQVFVADEIIAFYNLAPQSIGTTELKIKSNSSSTLTLEDENKNEFFINKITKEITARDAQGDETRLITSNSEYNNFMWKFSK